ncbi:hypothetical protein FSP39_005124 [Pinctada imbricata]|uniref:SH3 domain-containing protein n=1 Tax=Pinctada imbricata TaxID=66713 RepID=A0AA89BWW3_PINIB|nr:hypothetical protein FSP39_005124 [Pinctada imbricata]
MSEVAPPPPKRPTIIRQNLGSGERSGPPVPARPAPPVPPGSSSRSSTVDMVPTPHPKPPPPAHRPSVQRPSKTDDDLPPVVTRNHATKPSRPVSVSAAKTSDSVRRRPEITIVAARPMSEVGFRGEQAASGAKPGMAVESKTSDITGEDRKDETKNNPLPKVPPRKDTQPQRSQSMKQPPGRPPHIPPVHPSSVSNTNMPSSSVVQNDSLLLDLDIPDKTASDILVPLNSSVNSSVHPDEKDQSEDVDVKPRPKPAERPKAPPQRPASSVVGSGKPRSNPPIRGPPPKAPPPKVSPRNDVKETNKGTEGGDSSSQTAQQDIDIHTTQQTESKETEVKKPPPSKPIKPPVSKPAPARRAPPRPQPVEIPTPSEPLSTSATEPSSQTSAHGEQNQDSKSQEQEAPPVSPVYAAITHPVSKRPTIIRPASFRASTHGDSEKAQGDFSSDSSKKDADDSNIQKTPPLPARHYNDDVKHDVSDATPSGIGSESSDVQNMSAPKPVIKTKPSIVGRPKSFSLRETASKFEASSEQNVKSAENKHSVLPSPAPKPKPKPTVLAKPRSSSMPTEKSSPDTSIDNSDNSHHPIDFKTDNKETVTKSDDKEIGTSEVEKKKPERPTIIRPPAKPKRTMTDDSEEKPMVTSDDSQIPNVKHSPSPVLSKRPVSVMLPPGHTGAFDGKLSKSENEEENNESENSTKPERPLRQPVSTGSPKPPHKPPLPSTSPACHIAEENENGNENSKKPERPAKQPVSTGPSKPPHKPLLPSTSPAGHTSTIPSELASDACENVTTEDTQSALSSNKPKIPLASPSNKPSESVSEKMDPDATQPVTPSKPPTKPPLPSTKSLDKISPESSEDSPMQSSSALKPVPQKPQVPSTSPAVHSSNTNVEASSNEEDLTQSVVPSKPPPPVKSPVSVPTKPPPPTVKSPASDTNHASAENLIEKKADTIVETAEKDISEKPEIVSRPPPPELQGTNSSVPSTTQSQEEEHIMDQSKPDKPGAPSRPRKGPFRPAPKPSGKEREVIKKVEKPPPARPAVPQRESPPELPSRPGPGHPLYHYMLSTPHGIALHDFDASHQDELSLKVNEVVVLLKRVDDSWLMGQIGNRQGIFPQDFLAIQIPLPGELPPSDMVMNTADVTQDIWGEVSYQEEIQEKIDTIGKGPRCCARFDFEGGGAGDLQFEEGDYIKILERVDAEWLRGELNGVVGIFPISFVEIIEDLSLDNSSLYIDLGQGQAGVSGQGQAGISTNNSLTTSSSNENVTVQEQGHLQQDFQQAEFSAMVLHNHRGGPGELSLQFGDYVRLIHRISDDWLYGEIHGQKGKFPASIIDAVPPGLPQDGESQPHPSPKGTTHGTTLCVALYDFQSNDPGDLNFVTGDKIEIIEKLGDEWLKGKLNGKEGIFPSNFVKIEEVENVPRNETPEPKPVFTIDSPQTSDDIATTGTALYDFNGQNDSELSFKAGDIIILGDYVPGAEEWRIGELNGHQGMFPASFVN